MRDAGGPVEMKAGYPARPSRGPARRRSERGTDVNETSWRPSVPPSAHQPPLPVERVVRAEPPDPEAVPMDVLFVGGGPAGFAGAIALARLRQGEHKAGGGGGGAPSGVP